MRRNHLRKLFASTLVQQSHERSADSLVRAFQKTCYDGPAEKAVRAPSRIGALFALTLLLSVIGAPCADLSFDHSHQKLDRVLKQFVKDGLVDYSALRKDPKALRDYLGEAAAVREDQFAQWNQSQQLALLINVYNAATLDLILQYYPISTIKKIGSFFKGPWDQPVVHLFGKTITLNHLEHEILRQKYNEPRIHFAIVCAALGCPTLRSEAYRPDRLEEQLADQGRTFFSTKSKNRVDLEKRVVYLSPIFKWFPEDFEKKAGSVLKFAAPFFPPDVKEEMNKTAFKVRYTDYDWSLNDTSRK
jgi:hypothetical protein